LICLTIAVYTKAKLYGKEAGLKTKLTFRMEKELIEKAKEYSSKRGESVSKLVEKFFYAVAYEESEISPTVKRLKGFVKNTKLSEGNYRKFLEEKYL
jgi:hypothetical protein